MGAVIAAIAAIAHTAYMYFAGREASEAITVSGQNAAKERVLDTDVPGVPGDNDSSATGGEQTACHPEKPHDIQAPPPPHDNDPQKPHDIQAPPLPIDNDPQKPHDIQTPPPPHDNDPQKPHDIQAPPLPIDNDPLKAHDIQAPPPPRDNDPQKPQDIQAPPPPRHNDNIAPGCSDSSSYQSFSDCLISNRELIVDKLKELKDILKCLVSIDAITKRQSEAILEKNTGSGKVGELLDRLKHRGEEACRGLVAALRDTDQIHLCQLSDNLTKELENEPVREILSIDKYMTEMKVNYTEQIQERNEQEKRQYGNRVSLDQHVPVIINREHNRPGRQIRRGFDEFNIEKTDRKPLKLDDIFLSDKGSRPHSVLMLGGPGMGKTSLCFTILNRFSRGQWGGHQFIFFLMLKRFNNVALSLSLTDLLFDHGPIPMKDAKKASLFKQLSKRQASVLVILDGYDEFDEFITDDSFVSNPSTKSDVGIVLHSLLQGKLLPDSQVLITSRPFREIDMQHGRVVELAGLSDDSLNKLLGEFMGDTKEFLANHEDVANMLCIPINVQRFLSYLIWLRSQKQDILKNLPKTKSSLYSKQMLPVVMQCHRLIKKCDAEKKWQHPDIKSFVLKLAKLAGSAINVLGKKQVEFEFSDLDNCGLSEDDAKKGGLMTVFIKQVEDQMGMISVVLYYFTHLTTLEWCGGLYTASRDLKYIGSLIDSNSGELDVVLIFAVGLSGAAEGPQILQDLYDIPKNISQKTAHDMLDKIVHSKRCREPGGPQFALEAFFEGEFTDPRPLLSLLAPCGNVLQIADIALANRQAVGYFVRQLNSSQDEQTVATGTADSEIGLDTVRLHFTRAADRSVQNNMVAEVCKLKKLKHLLIETDGDYDVVVERPLDMLLVYGLMTKDNTARVIETSHARTLCLFEYDCHPPGSTRLSEDIEEIHLWRVYLHRDTVRSIAAGSSLRAITGLRYTDDTAADIRHLIQETPALQALGLWLYTYDEADCIALSRVVSASSVACLWLYVSPDNARDMELIRYSLDNASSLRELWLVFLSTPSAAAPFNLAGWVCRHGRLTTLSLLGYPINMTCLLRQLVDEPHSLRHIYTDDDVSSVERDVVTRFTGELRQVRRGEEGAFFTPLVYSDYLLTSIPSHVKEVITLRYVSPD